MKTAFHIATVQANKVFQALRNVENLLAEYPETEVAVVANTSAVTILKEDSQFQDRVEELADRGVEFKACRNSIESTSMEEDEILDAVEVVPSGVGELTRLQDEGYGYIKP